MEYITALISPFFLLLIEKFIPIPYAVEELFKFYLAKKADNTKTAIILGLLFSISESIFYVFNPSYILNPLLFVARLTLVSAMHITTTLVMYYFLKKRNLWPIGLITAILTHYLFNSIGSL
jgi:hypothetical protein